MAVGGQDFTNDQLTEIKLARQTREWHLIFWCGDESWYGNHYGVRAVINWGSSASDINIVSDTQIEGDGDIDRICGCLIATTESNTFLECRERQRDTKPAMLYVYYVSLDQVNSGQSLTWLDSGDSPWSPG